MPDPVFLDTNPIIRYLTQDNPDQAARARSLFERAAQGELALYLSESVVVEIVQVLSSRVTYNLPRSEVERHLLNVFSLRGFRIPQRNTYRRALELWVATPQVRDFVDCLSVAHMERGRIATIASFDEDFDRFQQIKRQEP